jgi:hypothetical protein
MITSWVYISTLSPSWKSFSKLQKSPKGGIIFHILFNVAAVVLLKVVTILTELLLEKPRPDITFISPLDLLFVN